MVFEYGRPQKVLDRLAWFTGIWSRLLPLNSGVNKHELCEHTKAKFAGAGHDIKQLVLALTQTDAFLYRKVVVP